VTSYVIVESSNDAQDLRSMVFNKFEKCFWLVLVLILLFRGLFLYSQLDFKNGGLVRNMSLDLDVVNPRSALTFLSRHGLHGRVFHGDSFGGYILWSSYPELRPFEDGRDITARFVTYNKIIQEPQVYWAKAALESDFKILLLDTRYAYTFTLIKCLDKK